MAVPIRRFEAWVMRGAACAAILLLVACGNGGPGGNGDAAPAPPSNVTATPGPGYVLASWEHDGQGVTGFEIRLEPGTSATAEAQGTQTVGPDVRRYPVPADPGTHELSVAALGEAGSSEHSGTPGGQGVEVTEEVKLVVGTREVAGEASLGTAFLLYYSLPASVRADPDVTMETTIAGPEGWNGGVPVSFTSGPEDPERQERYVVYETASEAVAGAYEMTVEVSGDGSESIHEAQFTLEDVSAGLEEPPSDFSFSSVTSSQVSLTWNAPASAASARAVIYDDGTNGRASEAGFTTGSSITLDGFDLASGRYVVRLTSFDVDVTSIPAEPDTFAVASDAAPFGVGSVTVAAGAVGAERQLTLDAVDRYEQRNPGVTVDVVTSDAVTNDRLGFYQNLFDAESPEVDVLQVDLVWIGIVSEHLVDLNQYGADEVADEHFEGNVENNTVEGELLAIPWFADAGLLYYRSDLLQEYGFTGPPTTWSELSTMAEAIQQGEQAEGNADFVGYVWQGDDYEGLTTNALEWIASSSGGTIISPDGVITIDNPAAVESMERAASWVGTISPTDVTEFREEDARGVFQDGNAAFMRNWTYAYGLGQGSQIADQFEVAPLPAGDGGSSAATLGGWQLAVSAYSDAPDLAAHLALFLASEEEQKTRAIEESFVPTMPSVYEDPEVVQANPFFEPLEDVLAGATARPTTVTGAQYGDVSAAFSNAVHDILTGAVEAAPELAALANDLQDLTGFPTGQP